MAQKTDAKIGSQVGSQGLTGLLRDKRVWSGLLGLLVVIVSSLRPELEDNLDHIVPAVIGIIGTMIGGFSLESAAGKYKPHHPVGESANADS